MGIKKISSLRLTFIKYLISIGFGLLIAIISIFGLMFLGIKTGIYVPANYIEKQVIDAERSIQSAKVFDESLIPKKVEYVFLSKDNVVLKTNLSDRDIDDFMENYKSDKTIKVQYRTIKRIDGVCIVRYNIKPFYTAQWMNQYLPSIDIMLIILTVISILLVCMFVTLYFARSLNRELIPIFDVVKNISEKNLDFEISQSKVEEFNKILIAMNNMKVALRKSLEEQWKSESDKAYQISSLAHDIKTPLTIISGNAEILSKSKLDGKQIDYVKRILSNKDRIDNYINKLIEINKTECMEEASFELLSIQNLVWILKKEISEYVFVNKCKVLYFMNISEELVLINKDDIIRGILNIVSNAVMYSQNDVIEIGFETLNHQFEISVRDYGTGFSNEDIKRAKEKFYQGDKSRSSKSNYGLGLYIADKIARNHGGTLVIRNAPDRGAIVQFSIPVNGI